MLRVDYDYQIFSMQQFGGISRYFYELAKRVAKTEGFSASIVAPMHINGYLANGGVTIRGMRIPRIPRTGRIISAFDRVASRLSYACTAPPDLLHETYYCPRTVAPRGCPTVITIYDMISEKFPADYPRGDGTSMAKRAAVARASRIICISENTRRDLISIFGIAPEKTTVVYLGFALTAGGNEPTARSPELPPFILHVGPRMGYKNFDRLLSAYAASPSLRRQFILLAFGSGPFSRKEQDHIRELGLDHSSVRQISGNDELLASLYRQAAIFVYPSLYEGFGIPPLEAMSFNCPVICGNTSSIPEVVGDAAYLFDAGSVDSLRCAMETVAASAALRADLVRRGRERIRRFSWDRCASETMQIYREAAQ